MLSIRMRRIAPLHFKLDSKWNFFASTASKVGTPAFPNRAGEFASCLRCRCANHLNRGRHGHGVGFALHAHYRDEPLAQAGGAMGRGVELPGSASDAQTLVDHTQSCVA